MVNEIHEEVKFVNYKEFLFYFRNIYHHYNHDDFKILLKNCVKINYVAFTNEYTLIYFGDPMLDNVFYYDHDFVTKIRSWTVKDRKSYYEKCVTHEEFFLLVK